MTAPLDPQPNVGRIFGNDWTIANIATLLRFNAGQEYLRAGPLIGGLREINENYPGGHRPDTSLPVLRSRSGAT